jgi:hypothetical protein
MQSQVRDGVRRYLLLSSLVQLCCLATASSSV